MTFSLSLDLGLHDHRMSSNYAPDHLGPAYRPAGQDEEKKINFRQQFLDQVNRKNVADAEDVDVNASLHGNWTMENAKSMLHQWMQTQKLSAEYAYSTVGPDHNRWKTPSLGLLRSFQLFKSAALLLD